MVQLGRRDWCTCCCYHSSCFSFSRQFSHSIHSPAFLLTSCSLADSLTLHPLHASLVTLNSMFRRLACLLLPLLHSCVCRRGSVSVLLSDKFLFPGSLSPSPLAFLVPRHMQASSHLCS